MSRGFRSSTLTRVGMFVLVGLLYLTLFEGEADSSFFASMGAVVVDVLLILVHQLKIVPAKYMQTVCCISCAVEGTAAIIAGTLVDSDKDILIARQWFIFGGQLSCLKLSFAIPKISLLRFPYLLFVLFAMLIAELACLFVISERSDSGGVGIPLMLIFLCRYNFD
ncbi:hypothetical protein TrCOL_g10868 [Triparma columacea]|uniref:Uncharacterized protein n=1 Tax=Triparma columacea TaxID=722753 RepID=A0A9W7G255_9STRA|nr:hypothetical protein TrCOL_g10868 [Triparma columacea]